MSDKPLDCVCIDLARSEVGKHDFQPSITEPIVHGIGRLPVAETVLKERSPESKEAYWAAKTIELVAAQSELDAVTRERDALHAELERLVAAKDEKEANGDSTRYRELKRGLWERARETLAKLASGELRKPGA